jgi:hypothetical protein
VTAAVITALIAAGASLIVAFANYIASRERETRLSTLEHDFRMSELAAEREVEAQQILDRYREPLVAAAFHLQDRLDNIFERSFLETYGDEANPRREAAKKTTLYRVAQYLGWVEILHRDIQFLKFPEPKETRAVTGLLARVGRTFATDWWGHEFMLWLEVQRAIGERMIEREDGTKGCVGYATFVTQYDEKHAAWLGEFEKTLTHQTALASERLRELHRLLRELVERLDPEELYFTRRWKPESSV